jgi:hypothetical protein
MKSTSNPRTMFLTYQDQHKPIQANNMNIAIDAYQKSFRTLQGQTLVLADKAKAHTALTTKHNKILSLFAEEANEIKKAQLKIKGEIDSAIGLQSNDIHLIPLMAGKSVKDLVESAKVSPAVGRLLLSDSGKLLGITQGQADSVLSSLASDQLQELESLGKRMDMLTTVDSGFMEAGKDIASFELSATEQAQLNALI